MEQDRGDWAPEQVAVADFALQEPVPHCTVLMLPTEDILTGGFPTEGMCMECIPPEQAVEDFHGAEGGDVPLVAGEAAAGKTEF